MFSFQLDAVDPGTSGRAGRWQTPHGTVQTPAFMPVGTLATVKGLLPEQLRAAGAQMVLANTYHLALRPGEKTVAEHGGLHRFMDWDGPILTDSGGFQVFSLASMRKLNDDRVVFRSHIDGALLELTPERAVEIQESLGADCIMCLDECPPSGESVQKILQAVDRTTRWAERCREAQKRTDQALFAIVQGGLHHLPELPGDLAQKVDPYLRPLYDALYDLMGFDRVNKAFERGQLEIAPLAFMRGRTLNHAFVILDEAQNTTPEQMKMFLTRIGFGSKAVVTGDISQIDLPKGTLSGLVDAERVLKRVKGISMCRFTSADVVRHPLVARIVDAYDAHRSPASKA